MILRTEVWVLQRKKIKNKELITSTELTIRLTMEMLRLKGNDIITCHATRVSVLPQPAGWRWCAAELGGWIHPAAVRSEPCPPALWSPSAPHPSDSGCLGPCDTCRSFSAGETTRWRAEHRPEGRRTAHNTSGCCVCVCLHRYLPLEGLGKLLVYNAPTKTKQPH